jgi:uncharacterized protein (DUF58 family)
MQTAHVDVTVNLQQLLDLRYAAQRVALTNNRLMRTTRAGTYLSHIRGRGMDFDETRNYQAGDDIRFMDWRVMARTGKAHTKLFREERERPVFIVVDQSASMHFGTRVTFKSVIAAQTAAILAWAAVNHGDRIGGVVFNDNDFHAIKPRSRKHGILHFLNQLVALNQQPPATANPAQFEQVLAQLRRVCHPGGLVFLISDFTQVVPQTVEYHLRALAQHNEIIACQVYDTLERQAPPPALYQLSNGQERIWLDTRISAIREKYMVQYQQQQSAFTQMLKRQGIPLLEIATHDDVAQVLYRELQHE